MKDLTNIIYNIVKNSNCTSPVPLWKIFAIIDGTQRIVPTYDEMNSAITKLILQDKLHIIDSCLYSIRGKEKYSTSVFTQAMYEQGLRENKKKFDEAYEKIMRHKKDK